MARRQRPLKGQFSRTQGINIVLITVSFVFLPPKSYFYLFYPFSLPLLYSSPLNLPSESVSVNEQSFVLLKLSRENYPLRGIIFLKNRIWLPSHKRMFLLFHSLHASAHTGHHHVIREELIVAWRLGAVV
jgi:hypothetical protein